MGDDIVDHVRNMSLLPIQNGISITVAPVLFIFYDTNQTKHHFETAFPYVCAYRSVKQGLIDKDAFDSSSDVDRYASLLQMQPHLLRMNQVLASSDVAR